jgi:hypothetical protein
MKKDQILTADSLREKIFLSYMMMMTCIFLKVERSIILSLKVREGGSEGFCRKRENTSPLGGSA